MVLVEALKAIVEIDGSSEWGVEGESDPTGGISRVICVVLVGDTGVVVSQIDLLCIGGGLE